MKKILFLFLSVLSLTAFCEVSENPQNVANDVPYVSPDAKPECTFLFIGEGVSKEMLALAGMHYENYGRTLNVLSSLPAKGSIVIADDTSYAFDPAATATAIACGRKTRSGFLAAVEDAPDGFASIPSVCHQAKIRGFKAGVITDSEINSPVPASFYASSTSWKKHAWVAVQMVPSQFDYFGASGLYGDAIERSVVFNMLLANGYTALDGKKELESYLGKSKLLVKSHASDAISRDETSDSVTLAGHVEKAVSVFDGASGFVIAVDARKIDEYCMNNDAAAAVAALGELDEAIGKAVEFMNAKKNVKTLIVFVSTGNAGGLKFTKNAGLSKEHLSILAAQKSTAKDIAEKAAKYVADDDGKNEKRLFASTCDFVSAQYGIALDETEKALLQSLWNGKKETFNAQNFTDAVKSFRDKRIGISWSGKRHYPYSVPVRAAGVGSGDFGKDRSFEDVGKFLASPVPTKTADDDGKTESVTTSKETE